MHDEQLMNLLAEMETHLGSVDTEYKKRILSLVKEQEKRQKRIQQSVKELQDSLDTLRVNIKYLVFDLEATKRENAFLRNEVERNDTLDSQGYYHPPNEELPPPDEAGFNPDVFGNYDFLMPPDVLDSEDDFWNQNSGGD